MDEIDNIISEFLITFIKQRHKQHSFHKYRIYDVMKADNEIFVHEILSWLFGFEPADENDLPSRILIGEAVDEFITNVLKVGSGAVLRRVINVDGKQYVVTGKPDIVFKLNDYYVVVDIKCSSMVRQYHVMQLAIYGWLAEAVHPKVKTGVLLVNKKEMSYIPIPYKDVKVVDYITAYIRTVIEGGK